MAERGGVVAMSVAATVAAARKTLAATLLTATCAKGATTFACFYDETPPRPGNALDFETGDGRGHTLYYRNADVTLSEGQAVTVNGLTLEVQRLHPIGLHDPLRRAEVTQR